MNAQQKLIEYGNELKTKSNTALKNMTAEEIVGQAFVEGICWKRDGSTKFSSRVTRQGKTITVTETKIEEVSKVIDGRMTFEKVETSNIVLTVEL